MIILSNVDGTQDTATARFFSRTPNSSAFQVAARYVPMTDVAGDFYDYVLDHERQLAVLIADVSGHGIPAALIASMVKLSAASHRTNAHYPGVALGKMNKSLLGNTQTQFVTAGLVYLDAELGLLRYSGAAHPPMLRLRGDEVTEIEENGLMLAAFDFAAYQSIETTLMPGDRYLMYTDVLSRRPTPAMSSLACRDSRPNCSIPAT